LFNIVLN